MRRLLIAVGIVGIATCVVVACTAFTDASEPADDAGDAAANALADRSELDIATSDAADGSAAADAGSGDRSPCLGSHWLCDDFDHDGGIGAPIWGSTGITDGGSMVIETLLAPPPPSPPRTMLVKARSDSTAVAYQATAVSGAGMHCELDLLVQKVGASQAIFFGLNLNNSSAYYRVELHWPGIGDPIRKRRRGSFAERQH